MTQYLSSNHLLPLAEPILSLVHEMLDSQNPDLSFEDYRNQLLAAFKIFEKETDNLEAKYALTAYIDERISYSSGSFKMLWKHQPLQLEFFEEYTAGEGFFKRLQELQKSPIKHIDTLELYYVCLQLGFKGKYRFNQEEALLRLKVSLLDQIQVIRGEHPKTLCASAPSEPNIQGSLFHPYRSLRRTFGVIGAFLLLLYVGFSIAMTLHAHRTAQKIENLKPAPEYSSIHQE